MRMHNAPVRLGVLNMTINVDAKGRYAPRHDSHSPQRLHYNSVNPKPSTIAQQNTINPYLSYRLSKREEANRSEPKMLITAFSMSSSNHSVHMTLENEFNQTERQVKSKSRDAKIRLQFHRVHLKNTIDVKQQVNNYNQVALNNYNQVGLNNYNQLALNLKNPQQNLKNIFTIRPVKTCERFRGRQIYRMYKQTEKPPVFKVSSKSKRKEQNQIKRIRPWSTAKQEENRVLEQEIEMPL